MLGQYEILVYRTMHLDYINKILSVCIVEQTEIILLLKTKFCNYNFGFMCTIGLSMTI